MKRWETLLALFAVVVASAAAFPIGLRLPLALLAIAPLISIGVACLRSAALNKKRASIPDAAERAERIRAEREARYHH
ncbi:MAG: hypothetical protein M3R30_09935 [Candidatus Eremiobacteraeota bacterium]|nr:hypothetical protein [Candidatus Eremiobacteraeota bacterium]